MKINSLFFLLGFFFLSPLSAQWLWDGPTAYTPETLKTANPDSVFEFYYSGNSYELGEDERDTVFNATALLQCKNLRKLTLYDIDAKEVLDNLDQFPVLEYLDLGDVKNDLDLSKIYGLRELTYLELRDFYLEDFDSTALVNSKIKTIRFDDVSSNCTEEDVCEFRFDYFPLLTNLTVIKSNINNLSHFHLCHQLERLVMNNCENIETIPLTGLKFLNEIRLSELYNCVEFPTEADELKAVKVAAFSNCGFAVDMDAVSNWSELRELYLYEIAVSDWDYLGNFSKLEYLTISNCNITEDISAMANCKQLRSLVLSENELTQFPLSITKLDSLKMVDLSKNKIENLPIAMSQMKALEELDLSFNKVNNIEEGALNLRSLKGLSLSYCNLSSLPTKGDLLPNIMWFYCNGNALSSIPPNWLNLSSLVIVELSNNNLSALPSSGWDGLKNIYGVHLGGNKITKLPSGIWGMTGLVELNLADNNLLSLPGKFSKMTALAELNLNGNDHIKYPKKLNKLPSLFTVRLQDTDFTAKEFATWQKKMGEKLVTISY